MKTKILTLIILILVSCTNQNKTSNLAIHNKASYKQIEPQNILTPSDSLKKSFTETLNTDESPVQIISSKLSDTQYSDHKDIKLTYKNVSKKSIKAIKFEWYCENALEKPASGRFFFVKGKSEGYSDILLKPKETRSQIWEDFSTDANKIIKARVHFVMFSNGTNWELKKTETQSSLQIAHPF